MAAPQPQSVPTHPIAPRIKNHHKEPHVGPDIDAYRDHHAKTVGEGSDEWWAQVRISTNNLYLSPLMIAAPVDRPGNSLLGSSLQDRACW